MSLQFGYIRPTVDDETKTIFFPFRDYIAKKMTCTKIRLNNAKMINHTNKSINIRYLRRGKKVAYIEIQGYK